MYNSVSFWSYWLWVSKINIYYRKSPFNPTPSNFYSSSLRRADTTAIVFAKSNKPPVSIKPPSNVTV